MQVTLPSAYHFGLYKFMCNAEGGVTFKRGCLFYVNYSHFVSVSESRLTAPQRVSEFTSGIVTAGGGRPRNKRGRTKKSARKIRCLSSLLANELDSCSLFAVDLDICESRYTDKVDTNGRQISPCYCYSLDRLVCCACADCLYLNGLLLSDNACDCACYRVW